MRHRWLTLPCALLLTLAASAPAVATFPDRNGLIAFSGQTDNGIEIFTMRPNGHDIRQITNLDGDAINVDWSPDGRRIAFQLVHEDDVNCDIGIVDADSGNLQVFDPGSTICDQWPAFFPDGRMLFERFDSVSGADALWIRNADGSDLHSIGNGPGLAFSPEVSPDGTRISFVGWNLLGDPDRQEGLFTMAVDGTDVRWITPQQDIFVKQDWAPDGAHLAVTTNAEDRSVASNILTLRPDGSDVRELTHYAAADHRAALASYSPDGQWVLFRLRVADDRALFRIRPDGSDLHQLTPWSQFIPLEADWGPASR